MINHIKGTNRDQLTLYNDCLDNIIENNNNVRFIDAYIDSLDLKKLNFTTHVNTTGRPSYKCSMLLKLYIYGYLEGIRSSRKLEKESKRNKELIWLMKELTPDFKTIADFRKNNIKALKNVFNNFVCFSKKLQLISLEKLAVDGTKIKAYNNKNNVYSKDEIDEQEKKIKNKIDRFLEDMEKNDEIEQDQIIFNPEKMEEIIKKLKNKKRKIRDIKKNLKQIKDSINIMPMILTLNLCIIMENH